MSKPGEASGVNGLILGGGRSNRMGHDKGLIPFHGKPQREFLFELLSLSCDEVFLSCKEEKDVPESFNPLPDRFIMQSPMNGILSAFQLNPGRAWLTAPTDMPGINSHTVDFLLTHRDPSKEATCFFDSEGVNPEPLFTLWEPRAYEGLMKYYKSGEISPRNFLKQSDVLLLHAPDPSLHTNINTPHDWERYKRRHQLP